MSKKLTQEEFISRCKEAHGDKYDYSKTEYINTRTKVVINCIDHGCFKQSPNIHFSGHGCNLCAIERSKVRKNRRLSQEDFEYKSNKIHNNKYCYNESIYTLTTEKIKIKCPNHGFFEQNAGNHMRGYGCPDCGREKVIKSRFLGNEAFIKKAKKIHKDKYTYLKCDYKGSHSKLTITCKDHGDFQQFATNHLMGNGCPECYLERKEDSWVEKGLRSLSFDSFKVYFIKCFDENEIFYKVGITYKTLSKRFRLKKYMPYNFDVVKIIEFEDGYDAASLEFLILNDFYEFKYIPKNKFIGQSECFSFTESDLEKVMAVLNDENNISSIST